MLETRLETKATITLHNNGKDKTNTNTWKQSNHIRNKYDVWQFRMYVKNARRYVEKSLRTKEQALAEERAEDLYIEIRNDMKLGKSFFAISIKEGVSLYLDYRKQDIGIADVGIVEGRYRTIVTHLNHYLDYVNKDTVAEVKRLILKHNLTKGDIRGKALKQLEL